MTELRNIELVATDLDGTFLKNDHSISDKNLEALHLLGEKNIIRVAATGRNLRKVKDVLHNNIPFDYIVYSSGAGIYDWKKQKHIFNRNIERLIAQELIRFFVRKNQNFHAFFPAPENHNHWFFRGGKHCDEFERYFNFNQAFAWELNEKKIPETEICQFLLIIPEDPKIFTEIKTEIEEMYPDVRVIRTSSPISNGFIWIEIFDHSVSKGMGVFKICKLLGIDAQNTIGLGNDYNDLDLLKFTGQSFITDNAADGIKNMFPLVPSNEKDGFAKLVQPIIL